jgi:hypothetical protein
VVCGVLVCGCALWFAGECDINDAHTVAVEVLDRDILGSDDILGSVSFTMSDIRCASERFP